MSSTELVGAERVVFARLRSEGDALSLAETSGPARLLDVMDDIDLIKNMTDSAPLRAECKLALDGYDRALWSRRGAA